MNRLRPSAFLLFKGACSSKLAAAFAAVSFCLFVTIPASGNIYPTNLRLQNSTNNIFFGRGDLLAIGYILNEPASGGIVAEILSDTNVVRTLNILSGPGTARGSNTIFWDGKDELSQFASNGLYGVRITAKSNGYSDWTQITDDNGAGNFVWEPRGIAVNCNSNSPFYGRVFVGNAYPNPVRSTLPGDRVGILKLNADASPAEEGEYSNGGYPWMGDFFSPWKIEVSGDDKVYINDWTANGTVVAFDQVISTNFQIILSTNNWPPVGINPNTSDTNYANLSGPFITGTGTNTQIWMADISFNQDTNIARCVGVRRWNVTTNGSVAEGDIGTTIVQAGDGSSLNLYPYDVTVDKYGRIYAVQYRVNPNDTAPKVLQFPPYDESGSPLMTANWVAGEPGTFLGAFGVAVNRDATLVAVALKEGGALIILDAETGTNVTTINVALGHDRRDVAWDNVGNVYSLDNSDSLWRVFSPPGTNQATTIAFSKVMIIEKPALTEPQVNGSQFQCLLSGETNFNYVVESSVNLSNWIPVVTNFLSNPTQAITIDAQDAQHFYRAVLAP